MQTKRAWFIALGILAVYLGLAIAGVRTVMPWSDEAWFSSPALNLLTKGYMGTSVLDPTSSWRTNVLTGINQYTYWIVPLYPLAQAGWYKLVGFSLYSMRLLSVGWGLVALLAWYGIMKALSGDRRVALLTVALLAIDFQFLWSASVGRMDMMCAALGQAGLAAFLLLRPNHFPLAVLVSQSLVAASGLSHPVGLVAFVELLFLLLYYDRTRIRLVHVGIAAIPYLVGTAGWGWYISKNPSYFVAQFGGNAADRFLSIRSPLEALRLQFVERYLYMYGFAPTTKGLSHLKIFVLLAYVVGVVGALSNRGICRQKGYRVLLLLWAISSVTLSIIDWNVSFFYLIHFVQPLVAVLAVWVIWCWDHRTIPRWVLTTGLAGLVCVQLGVTGYRMAQNAYENSYMAAVRVLKQNTSKTDLIMGSAELAFQLGFDSNLVDDYRLGFRSGKKPDVVVIDENHYAEWIPLLLAQEPDTYRYITQMLSKEFQPVYKERAYEIYVRKNVRPTSVSADR